MSTHARNTDHRAGSPGGDGGIALLCNPRAGGRSKELADILRTPEAQGVQCVVTDSVADVGPALERFEPRARLLCVYGGDGTIQRVMDQMQVDRREGFQLAFIGGGTMNVNTRWCGLGRQPKRNFQQLVRAYRTGRLPSRQMPVLRVEQSGRVRYCFTFGMGPMIRLINEYEIIGSSKAVALGVLARTFSAIWTSLPARYVYILRPTEAEVYMDGERLPYEHFSGLFCNTTGQLHMGVVPFVRERSRETFFTAAYAVTKQEIALWLPLLARGFRPLDPRLLLAPLAGWQKLTAWSRGRGAYPADPRYINDVASRFVIHSAEEIYTVDGEVVQSTGEPITVEMGPRVSVSMNPPRS